MNSYKFIHPENTPAHIFPISHRTIQTQQAETLQMRKNTTS